MIRAAIKRATGRGALLRADLRIDLPAAPLPVKADAAQVGIVLDNLINNALTYSLENDPWLEVKATRDGGFGVVTVSDHGIGIPPEMQAAIFERFRRVTPTAGDVRPGTGLGLAIARDLTELNGGELRLDASAPGQGSRFLLRFPLPEGEDST